MDYPIAVVQHHHQNLRLNYSSVYVAYDPMAVVQHHHQNLRLNYSSVYVAYDPRVS
jgi:hypothetical protein